MLRSFVAWHLRLGFARIYLYFDDPRDDGIACARRLRARAAEGAVVVLPSDGGLRSEWAGLTTYAQWGERAEAMVEVRQMLNCEHALRRAHADADIHWLLHIDSDELFFIEGLDAASHFGRLSAHGCSTFTYPIHEGCPERIDSSNVFEEVSLFRTHPAMLHASVVAAAAPERARAAYDFWRARHRSQTTYFLGSAQGKSAVRVVPGARPMSVHTFYPGVTDGGGPPKCWVGFENDDPVGANLRVMSPMGAPCILHYISCSFEAWLLKYQLLGRFADTKPSPLAGQIGEQIGDCFHTTSRDLVTRAGRAEAREAYVRQVSLDDPEAERQIEAGVCFRRHEVRRALSLLDGGEGGG